MKIKCHIKCVKQRQISIYIKIQSNKYFYQERSLKEKYQIPYEIVKRKGDTNIDIINERGDIPVFREYCKQFYVNTFGN